jgi:hypothetical protein
MSRRQADFDKLYAEETRQAGSIVDAKPKISWKFIRWLMLTVLFVAHLAMLVSIYVRQLYSYDFIAGTFLVIDLIFWPLMVYVVYSWNKGTEDAEENRRMYAHTPRTRHSGSLAEMSYDDLTRIGKSANDE